jgi:hypothetical protein
VADNSTRIVITADDRASGPLGKVGSALGSLGSQSQALTGLMGGLTAAFSVGSIVAFTKGTIDAADTMNDLSQRVGIGIKELAGWQLAADQSGTSIEAVARGVKGLSTYMVEHADKLQAAGITAKDANGAMIQLADLFAAMPDGVEKTALAVQLFGKAGMDMIPMLNQGSKGLAESQQKSADYAAKLKELAPQADAFNDLLAELGLNSKAAGINIANYLMPSLLRIAGAMNDIATGGEKARAVMQALADNKYLPLMLRAAGGIAVLADNASAAANIGRGGSRLSTGRIGGALPAEVAPETAAALATARSILDKSKPAKTGTDPEAERLKRMLELGQRNLAATLDSEEEMRLIAEKREADEAKHHAAALARFQERIQARELEEYYATAGEETMREVMEKQNAALKEQNNLAKDLGMTFTSAFEDAIVSGKGFSSVLQGLAQDLSRIVVRKSITEPLGNALSSSLSKISWSSLFGNADGGVYTSPSLSAYSGSIVSSPTLFKFANGAGFNTGLMGEAGPEAILPLKRGSDGKLGVQGGGNVQVVQHISIDARSDQATIMAAMVRAKEAAKKEILESMRRGGAFA